MVHVNSTRLFSCILSGVSISISMSPEIRKNIYFIANNFFNFKEQEIIFCLTQNEVNRPVWNSANENTRVGVDLIFRTCLPKGIVMSNICSGLA